MHDLIIRNGTVVDGTGMPRFRADIGVTGNRIAAIGKIREAAVIYGVMLTMFVAMI